jgi:phospholipase/carboxylesterase
VHQFWTPAVEAVETRRTGFGWLTNHRPEPSQARHHALVEAVIAEARREFGADRARVLLMGFSQSCALNYRLAFTRPGLLRGVIGVCGGIPGDFDDPKYREIPASILHIAASQDPFYSTDRTRGFAGALRRLARDVTYREYESGHVFPRDSLSFIREWILARCSGQGTGIG